MTFVGIDPGMSPGVAVWDSNKSRFTLLKKFKTIYDAQDAILQIKELNTENIFVILEDARKRKFFGGKTPEQMQRLAQGAGSIKAQSKLWEQWLIRNNINHDCVAPRNTKYDAERFRKVTGYQGSTNKESRDAAMMVFQRSNYRKF